MKVRRVGPVAVLTATWLALAACSSTTTPLPSASAYVGATKVDMPHGSYCWNSGGNGECVDIASPDDLLKSGHLKPVVTAGGLNVRIELQAASQPREFMVDLLETPAGLRLPAVVTTGSSFLLMSTPPAEPGIYVFGVTGTWQEGDVSFLLAVQLESAQT